MNFQAIRPMVLLVAFFVGIHGLALGNPSDPEISPYAGAAGWRETYDQRVQWFKDAKFGMFIHWGLYSPAGGYWPPNPESGKRYDQHYAEWIRNWARVPEPEYGKSLKPLFSPQAGCTDQWAKLAKTAGMRYAVLTAKHHEGYTLFNSEANYSVSNDLTGGTNISPEGRDMFGEYVESMRKEGVKPGFYYSIIDWQHPDAYNLSRPFAVPADANHGRYVDYMSHHLDELATNYGDVALIWIDYSNDRWQGSTWQTRKNLSNLIRKQPHIITNNRWWNDLSNRNGDYFSPEKWVPAGNKHNQTFEVCHTMNESFGFSYHDQKWKSGADVIRLLCDISSKGGNLLMNVGPDRSGNIPQACVDSLSEVGAWLNANGQAIYGTTASPFRYYTFDGVATLKSSPDVSKLYLLLNSLPDSGEIELDGLQNVILAARLLFGGEAVGFDSTSKTVQVPVGQFDGPVMVIQIDIEGECNVDSSPMVRQKADRSVVLPSSSAELIGPQIRLERLNNNIGYWLSPDAKVVFGFSADRPETVRHTGGSVEREPGVYDVILTAAVDTAAGGRLTVTLDTEPQQQVIYEMDSTGGWHDYKQVSIGQVTLEKPGDYTLTLEGAGIKPGGFINLKEVRLQPES